MDPANPPTLRSRLLTGCVGLLAVPVLYFAGFGPFYYVYARAGIQNESLLALYFPLLTVADRSPTTRRWFFTYANWFLTRGERHRAKAGDFQDQPAIPSIA